MKKNILTLVFAITINIGFSQQIKFGKISKEELEEKTNPLDSLADATFLYKSIKTGLVYNVNQGGFECKTYVHNKIKIYNDDGFDYATETVALYAPSSNANSDRISSLKAYTYNLEGGKIKKTQTFKKRDLYRKKK